jgi:tetratricopeptide (TPR) repeat protein
MYIKMKKKMKKDLFFKKLFTNLILLIFFSPVAVFSQYKDFSSAEKLAKEWIKIVQKGDTNAFATMQAPAEIYKKIAPESFAGKTSEEILKIINTEEDNILVRSKAVINALKSYNINAQKINFLSLTFNSNPLVAKDYYLLTVLYQYENTSDTIHLEAYQESKKWYWTDLATDASLSHIIRKHTSKTAPVLFQEGISEKDDQKAVEFFDKATFLKENYKEAFFQKGMRLKALKKEQEAKSEFLKAISFDADYSEAYWEYANITNANGLMDNQYYFERCVELNYKVSESLVILTNISYSLIKASESRNEDIKYYCELLLKQLDQLLSQPDITPEIKFEAFLKRGFANRYFQKNEEALKDYEDAIKIGQNIEKQLSTDNFMNLIWLSNELRDYKNAIQYYKKAIQKTDDTIENVSLQNEAAYAYKNLLNPNEAIRIYQNILKLNPEYPYQNRKFWVNIGDCYVALKQNIEACKAYNKAKETGTFISEDTENFLKNKCK